MSNPAYSASESDASECAENSYCIFLHLVEGIGLNRRDGVGDFTERHKDKVILVASLNGVKFEVEGHSTETVTIFNNNCIWECELGDIKRMKTDNRPVKLEISLSSGRSESSPRRPIGSLLLPIRGVQVVTALKNVQLKLHWHKLNVLSSEWRQNKPEIYLLLAIVKKNLIDNGKFEAFVGRKKCRLNDGLSPNISETSLMLQSQSNVYVQLLEQVGLIQVGNNPDVDCDIFNVTLTFKQVKNLMKLLEVDRSFNRQTNVFIFHYDFLGSASQLEMMVNPSDTYTINEKISLSFKSSLKSLRTYFQRIFYIPITVFLNGVAIANYRLDFSKLLPDDTYFQTNKNWSKHGTFQFERLSKSLSPIAPKPSVEFIFGIQLITAYSKKSNSEILPYGDNFVPFKIDEKAAGDVMECYRNMDYTSNVTLHKRASYDGGVVNNRNYHNYEIYERNYMKMQADALVIGRVLEENSALLAKSSEDLMKANADAKQKECSHESLTRRLSKPSVNACIGSEKSSNSAVDTSNQPSSSSFEPPQQLERVVATRSIAVNTENREPDTEELTLKIVQELEEWKSQQMDHFIQGLAEKEEAYLVDLDQQWEQQRAMLQAKLEAKIAACEKLNAKLEKAYNELNANAIKHQETIHIVQTVKQDIELSYAKKFHQLDEEMQRLKDEMLQRTCESAEREWEAANMQAVESNKQLAQEQEKVEMKTRIDQLEKQLSAMEKTHFSAEQLQGMLADLRKQTDRFADLEKTKNYYKEQWTKSTRALHKLQINVLQQEEEALHANKQEDEDICLEEILEEEQEALISDRSELKYIKTLLYDSSESASFDEIVGE